LFAGVGNLTPQRLKPRKYRPWNGTAEAVPLQNMALKNVLCNWLGMAEAVLLQKHS